MALLVVAILSIPAWIPLAIVVIVSTLLTGFDNVASEQLDRRFKEQQEADMQADKVLDEIITVQATPTTKPEVQRSVRDNKIRKELMIDLKICDIDTSKFEGMTTREIFKALTKKELAELNKLRRFMNDH